MSEWKTVERPGYLGKKREEKFREWNAAHGEGNWRLAWRAGLIVADFLGACALYEDAYFVFLSDNPRTLMELAATASDVYDDDPSNVRSGYDYAKQETGRTHIQDIAIRRCLLRMHGFCFMGDTLIQIRDKLGTHSLSMRLSPGRIPFHFPDLIVEPELAGWWDPGSVESFYQSNKVLQVRNAE